MFFFLMGLIDEYDEGFEDEEHEKKKITRISRANAKTTRVPY